MAVYTEVSAEAMAEFLRGFDVGELRSFKGIAEGVENSNYLVETSVSRFILTLYEKRVDAGDLPFFMGLLDHLAGKGCLVPCAIKNREDRQILELCGRPACLIEFLHGVSVTHPTPAQAKAAGAALAQMHNAVADFTGNRPNSLSLPDWHRLAADCAGHWDEIDAGLEAQVLAELAHLDQHWPRDLPMSVIHADLFPDNVLMIGETITGLIDFYFSCTDFRAYDLAIMHGAWCFTPDGRTFDRDVSDALIAGYRAHFTLSDTENAALGTLARGGALRFTLTRAYDWINTPATAMVTRKDPMAFARRLAFYAAPENATLFA